MDDKVKLEAIQLELDQVHQKLRTLFGEAHPRFNDVFEDVGEAEYYIREARYRIQAVIKTRALRWQQLTGLQPKFSPNQAETGMIVCS